MNFRLKKGDGFHGRVVSLNGTPISGAQVLIEGFAYATLGNRSFETIAADEAFTKTDARGRFALPALHPNPDIFVVHDLGYAEITGAELTKTEKVVLQPRGASRGW